MNPYVSFGIAMCLVVGIALFFTAYLAVMFNRRAKRDLLSALTPLGVVLDGTVDLENATASGRYRGHIAEGRVANAPDGPGRVFYTSVIDGAGGGKWTYTVRKPREPEAPLDEKFEGPGDAQGQRLRAIAESTFRPVMTVPGWLRVEYDPAPGHVRLTRPMQTRRDVPNHESFIRQLDLLVAIADGNRAIQQG